MVLARREDRQLSSKFDTREGGFAWDLDDGNGVFI